MWGKIWFFFFLAAAISAVVIGILYSRQNTKCVVCPACPTSATCPTCDTSALQACQDAVSSANQTISDTKSILATCNASASGNNDYFYLNNYNLGDTDIRSVTGTVQQCVYACEAEPKCGAVVRPINLGDNDVGSCYLKPNPIYDTRFRTYVPKRNVSTDTSAGVHMDMEVTGFEYSNVPNVSEGECYNRCDSDIKCMAASFNAATQSCSLKTASAPLSSSVGTNTYTPPSMKKAIPGCGYGGMTRGWYKLGSDIARNSFCRYVGDSSNTAPNCIINGVDTSMVQMTNNVPTLDSAGKQIPISMNGEDGKLFNIESTPHDTFDPNGFYCMW